MTETDDWSPAGRRVWVRSRRTSSEDGADETPRARVPSAVDRVIQTSGGSDGAPRRAPEDLNGRTGPTEGVTPNEEGRFVERVLEWYRADGRHELPWRAADASAFEVLVAELMLQRTSVDQVTTVYPEFVERYPTPESVIAADETALAAEFEPLGLAKRAEYLVRISERVVREHDGEVPTERSDLLDLRGVGEYTARSVLAQVRGADEVAVDRNVERVLSRAFESEVGDDPSSDELSALAERLAPEGRGGDFTLALIDFAAAVCTARHPACDNCPVREICEYYDRDGE